MLNSWDLAYLIGFTPWDSGQPARELVEKVEGGLIKPCRVLDVGCGTGANVVFLAEKGFEAHGLDISKIALLKARRRAAKRGVKCFFHQLDFLDSEGVKRLGAFDLAIDIGCYHTIHSGRDRVSYVSSLTSVLKGGGEYLLWCFQRGKLYSWGPTGVDRGEIERYFGERYAVLESRRINTLHRDILFFHMRFVG